MREAATQAITEEVLHRLERATSPRVKSISEALVRHLHAFVREVQPSVAEWEQAIAFLTDAGARCTPGRQEFILLSDALGISTLVDLINASTDPRVTESTVLGPFYVQGPPQFKDGASIVGDREGVPLLIQGKVTDVEGDGCPGATVDIWQSDSEGFYDVQRRDSSHVLRGRFVSDTTGAFATWSIVPSSYSIPHDGPVGKMLELQGRHPFRPAHVHFRISCEGFSTLTTHLFAKGDPYLDSDVVFGVKASLIEDLSLHDPNESPVEPLPHEPFAWLRRTFVLDRVDHAC